MPRYYRGILLIMEENNQNNEVQIIQERVKERPLNRRKLAKRMIITASMAVIFGVLACLTFLVLEPVFSNMLHPQEEPEPVVIPSDTDEILPEDMMLEDEVETQTTVQVIRQSIDADAVAIYSQQYQDMHTIAQNTRKSIVTVTSVNQELDWFDNTIESTGSSSGLYIANNGLELLFLTYTNDLQKAEKIVVTFYDGTEAVGELKQSDVNTGLSIVSVGLGDVTSSTLSSMTIARLANSKLSTLMASPVIAMGKPYGSTDAVAYGILASKDNYVNLPDQNYEILTTNIYGSSEATGILINLNGEVLGIIEQQYNPVDTANLVSAIGISDLKRTIERMSNGKDRGYFGVYGMDVTYDAQQSGVPIGAYVTGIVMGSPAMKAGIQSGDIIVGVDDIRVEDYKTFTELIANINPDTLAKIVIMRQSPEGYREVNLDITIGESK